MRTDFSEELVERFEIELLRDQLEVIAEFEKLIQPESVNAFLLSLLPEGKWNRCFSYCLIFLREFLSLLEEIWK